MIEKIGTVVIGHAVGDDTDMVAAITGGLVGALYGYDAISKE